MKFVKDFLDYLDGLSARELVLKAVYLIGIVSAAAVLTAAVLMRKILSDIPSVDKLDEYTPSLTTYVYDINNNVIAEFSVEKRAILPLNKIPVDMQNAVIAMEDQNFFRHWGISPRGIARALMRDILHRRTAQGGSTLTQQLSKNIFLERSKTITRKIKEMVLALQIERNFSKQEILALYLNQIYFGSGVYGVQSAARLYFGKDVSEMTLGECALLTGLIPNPARFSPFAHPDTARLRRRLVLQRMKDEGYVTAEEVKTAEAEPIPDEKFSMHSGHAAYFVEYIRQQLEPKYGTAQLWKGGMKIYTTLDLSMQIPAEEGMERNLAKYDQVAADARAAQQKAEQEEDKEKGAEDEEGKDTAAASSATLQGAFVILDTKTGAIKAMIGGRDFQTTKFNRVTQAARQAGSTFKPFVWMSALLSGYTPASMIEDSPMAYYNDGKDWRLLEGATDQYAIDLAVQPFVGNKDFQIWVPNDFDGKFLGRITLRHALEQSRNLASIYLVTHVGPTLVADVAHRAGVKHNLEAVPSIGLGTSGVNPLEMASAFSTFANGGIHAEPFAVLRVTDNQGRVLEESVPEETEAFSPQLSYVLVNMMKGVIQRGTGIKASTLKRPLAGKTGTSQDAKDMWFIGMTPDLTAASWMGYDDFASIPVKDWSSSLAVTWWTDIMASVFKNQPVRDFPVPDGIVFVTVDQETGKLALPTCKKKILEAFVKGTEPKEFCDAQH
ncbi:MAG: transglycosylase domain-containing protein [Elusimicrobia bacterium]|nr:transglycosylase domain-containing protein [Elusimicrobiota bacterium]